jgi:hypothetical protein
MIFRLCWYFGLGALAHWLWIGSHVDVSDIFTWVCILLGPLMVLAWLFVKAFWLFLVLILMGIIAFIVWVGVDDFKRRRRRKIIRIQPRGKS